jgi:PAS domain S-box-containing protein
LITDAQTLDEPRHRIVYVNEAFTDMTGYRSDEVNGKSPRLLQGPLTSRQSLDTIRSALENKQPIQAELVNYRKDGSWFWSQISIVPVADEMGKITHWISIQRDVSKRKIMEQELQAAKQEAERANTAKSEFLSQMSHDLRTPLNAILGFGQLLEIAPLEERDAQSVEQIMRGGRHLLGLINEVLDIASVESGNLKLDLESVLVVEMCGLTLSLIKTIAAERRITIYDQSFECPAHVMADQRRFRQILLNLLSNAVKYNSAGGSLTLWCEARDGDKLRICVKDEGQGIPLEKQSRLFVPFDRLDMEQEGIEGTGIGLSFSRLLAEALSGQLGFHSEVGKGSTFWVELPLVPEL